jgi:hypothetical protein
MESFDLTIFDELVSLFWTEPNYDFCFALIESLYCIRELTNYSDINTNEMENFKNMLFNCYALIAMGGHLHDIKIDKSIVTNIAEFYSRKNTNNFNYCETNCETCANLKRSPSEMSDLLTIIYMMMIKGITALRDERSLTSNNGVFSLTTRLASQLLYTLGQIN